LHDEAGKKQEAKRRDHDKIEFKLRRLGVTMAPIQSDVNLLQRQIDEWISSNSESGLLSVDAIRTKANELTSRRRGISSQSLQKQIASETKTFRQKEATLELPEGGIETVNARFQEQEEKLESIQREIDVHKANWKQLGDIARTLADRHHRLLHFLAGSIECSYSEYLAHKNYKGKMIFDHEKFTLTTNVDVNSRDSSKAVSSAGSHKNLSGGENSYSNVCLLLALSSVSPCPWQVLDEFDVFM
jgi:chromosome segregation ATPase